MIKSDLFSSLPDINFAEKNPDIITSEVISTFENLSARSLAPGDPVRIFFDSVILAIIQLRNLIDKSAKMNLLAYASGDYLDHIGSLLGVSRLEASPASAMFQFSLSDSLNFNVLIPAGTKITPDGNIFFALDENISIPAGQLAANGKASCTTAGTAGNGFAFKQINKLVDIFPYELSCFNYTESAGGYDTENDENFRERIHIAPESFSNAGSKGAYLYFTKSANSSIIDAAILTPPETEPGHVNIYPLLYGGEIPSDEIISQVLNVVNADNIRPDTDFVSVLKPEIISYDINFNFWVDNNSWSNHENISLNVNDAVNNFISWQKSALGRHISPSKLTADIMNAGASHVEISSPSFRKLEKFQVAIANNISINFKGLD